MSLVEDSAAVQTRRAEMHREHKRWDRMASPVEVRYVEPTMTAEQAEANLPPGVHLAKHPGFCQRCRVKIIEGQPIRKINKRNIHALCTRRRV